MLKYISVIILGLSFIACQSDTEEPSQQMDEQQPPQEQQQDTSDTSDQGEDPMSQQSSVNLSEGELDVLAETKTKLQQEIIKRMETEGINVQPINQVG